MDLVAKALFYVKRKNLEVIHRRLTNICVTAIDFGRNVINNRCIFILLLNDVTVAMKIFMRMKFYYLFNNDKYVINISIWLWNLNNVVMPACFCWYCFTLKCILRNVKKHLNKKIGVTHWYRIYDKIADLVAFINKIFQINLFFTFINLLLLLFYYICRIIFSNQNNKHKTISSGVFILNDILKLSKMCSFSSSLSNMALEVKERMFKIPCEVTPLVMHVQNKFVGFSLFGSVAINNIFLISSLGALLIYGIMIATFDIHSERSRN